MLIPLPQILLLHISSPSKMSVIKKAKGLLRRFYCTLISFQRLALRAHFFSCFDLKMQWKYLAFRWHAAGEVWWISAFSEDWISSTAPGPVGLPVGQTDRRTTGWPGSGIPSLPRCCRKPGTAKRRAAAAGNANALPRLPSRLGSSDWLNTPLASWLWLAESLSTQKWLIHQY